MLDEGGDRRLVEAHPARLVRLRPLLDEHVPREDQAPLDRRRPPLEVEVPPAQRHELAAPGARRSGHEHEHRQHRVGLAGQAEQASHLVGRRRVHRPQRHPRRRGVEGGVVPQPPPPDPLGERPADDAVDPLHRRWRVGTLRPAHLEQVPVEAVEVDRRQLRDRHGAQGGDDHRPDVAAVDDDRLRRQARRRVLEPLLEEPGEGGLPVLAGHEPARLGDELGERPARLALRPVERLRHVPLALRDRVRADVDAQLPGVLPALAQRSGRPWPPLSGELPGGHASAALRGKGWTGDGQAPNSSHVSAGKKCL